MPYKLTEPKAGRSPFYRIRGTEFGRYLDRSLQTSDKRAAHKFLGAERAEAQRLALSGPVKEVPKFGDAALSYMRAGGERQFMPRILEHFRAAPLGDVTQGAIDECAAKLYPGAGAPTRNRAVYTPISAVLRHAGVAIVIKRPRGAGGSPRPHWLRPEQAFALIEGATAENERFGALLAFLLYTGCRLSEALRLEWADVDLSRSTALLRETKNGSAITVHLVSGVVSTLAVLPRDRRVFGISKCGRLYDLLDRAARRSGISLPPRAAFHVLRHTHATWRRLYTGADTTALTATGLWKSRNAAAVYEHVDVSEEARKADRLPTSSRAKSVRERLSD